MDDGFMVFSGFTQRQIVYEERRLFTIFPLSTVSFFFRQNQIFKLKFKLKLKMHMFCNMCICKTVKL